MPKIYEDGDVIDVQALITAVRELAAERPDFVYPVNSGNRAPSCYYTKPDGTGDCIIGCAMERIGHPLPVQNRDGEGATKLLSAPVSSALWAWALNIPEAGREHRWLGRVQAQQDTGDSWGDAVAYANRWDSDYSND